MTIALLGQALPPWGTGIVCGDAVQRLSLLAADRRHEHLVVLHSAGDHAGIDHRRRRSCGSCASIVLEPLDAKSTSSWPVPKVFPNASAGKHALRNALIPVVTYIGLMLITISLRPPSPPRSCSVGLALAAQRMCTCPRAHFPMLQFAVLVWAALIIGLT